MAACRAIRFASMPRAPGNRRVSSSTSRSTACATTTGSRRPTRRSSPNGSTTSRTPAAGCCSSARAKCSVSGAGWAGAIQSSRTSPGPTACTCRRPPRTGMRGSRGCSSTSARSAALGASPSRGLPLPRCWPGKSRTVGQSLSSRRSAPGSSAIGGGTPMGPTRSPSNSPIAVGTARRSISIWLGKAPARGCCWSCSAAPSVRSTKARRSSSTNSTPASTPRPPERCCGCSVRPRPTPRARSSWPRPTIPT